MKTTRLSIGQRKSLAEFFTNGAVAWLTVGVVTPLLAGAKLIDFIKIGIWGISFTILFIWIALYFSKGVK